jgi:hypothetical protein
MFLQFIFSLRLLQIGHKLRGHLRGVDPHDATFVLKFDQLTQVVHPAHPGDAIRN